MKKSNQHHHPKKGDNITVEPIRRIEDIKSISKLLSDSPRNHLLFTMGINNGLRVGDLLKLKVKAVRNLKIGDTLNIKESKTGKDNILVVNKAVHKSLKNYLEKVQPGNSDYLFASRKGNKAITIQAVNNMIKKWTRAINLAGNYGAHTLERPGGICRGQGTASGLKSYASGTIIRVRRLRCDTWGLKIRRFIIRL